MSELDVPSPIEEVTFRPFARSTDLRGMSTLRADVRSVEGDVSLPGPDDPSSGPAIQAQPALVALSGDRIVGYSWLTCWEEQDGTLVFLVLGAVSPEFRRRGIGSALLRWGETKAREARKSFRSTGTAVLAANADEGQSSARELLLSEGYRVAFTKIEMTCDLRAVRDVGGPILSAAKIRPAELGDVEEIYSKVMAWFRRPGMGFEAPSREQFLSDLDFARAGARYWLVAVSGDAIVGSVLNRLDGAIATTPWLAVDPGWRRRGLGTSLMAASLRVLLRNGCREARLSTIEENATGARDLYSRLGYRLVRRLPRYRKPL